MKYAVLGSGSSANAYVFESGDSSYLFDNGFSCRELTRRAAAAGFDLSRLKYIFLTHVHSDHLKGVASVSRKYAVPVAYHEELPLHDYLAGGIFAGYTMEEGRTYEFGPLSLRPFRTSHDAPYSLGYHFELEGTVFTILTDTGTVTGEMKTLASRSDILFLEANYDERMLQEGTYPAFLKARISSGEGHLSNSDAVRFLNSLGPDEKPGHVFFCHLSGNNNTPEALEHTIRKELRWKGTYRILKKGELFSCDTVRNTLEESEICI